MGIQNERKYLGSGVTGVGVMYFRDPFEAALIPI